MRQVKGMRLWSVIYPVCLYFAVCQIMGLLLQLFPPTAGLDAVKRQAADSGAGLVVLYLCFVYKKGGRIAPEKAERGGSAAAFAFLRGLFAAAVLTSCAGVALNNLIALTSLRQTSEGYQAVEQAFYSSSLFWEIAALCVLSPAAEELLYRGIVLDALRDWLGRSAAVVCSALLFGLMHMNVVQALYAFLLGLLLGILMEYYRDVRVVMCGHMAANLVSVLRTERGFLRWSWFTAGSGSFLPVTLALLLLVVVFAGWYVKSFKNASRENESKKGKKE